MTSITGRSAGAFPSSASSSRSGPNNMRQRHDASTSQQTAGPSLVITRPPRKPRSSKGKEKAVYHEPMSYEAQAREYFRKFGEHVARNQIRTLLIDCLVMTNLFYPSLALYLQKRFPPLHPPAPPSHNTHRIPTQGQAGPSRQINKEHPLSLLSTPVLDSFFPYPPPLLPRLTWAGWWGRDTGQHAGGLGWAVERLAAGMEDPLAGLDEEVRVMRIGWADVVDVLDRASGDDGRQRAWLERDQAFLQQVISAVEMWEDCYGEATGARCVRQLAGSTTRGAEAEPSSDATKPCYVLSPDAPTTRGVTPLSRFQHLEDASLLRSSNDTEDALPVNWEGHAGNIYHSMAALFHVRKDKATAFDAAWADYLANASAKLGGEVFVEAKGPAWSAQRFHGEWALSYASGHPPAALQNATIGDFQAVSSSPPLAIWIGYLVLFSVLGYQLSNASKVHSRFGLAFTGIVQLCCSSVMSFSVLALLGWNGWGSSSTPTTLPTYILPFVIVIVGAENMSTLTRAVFSIPFTSSVPVRIGLALSKAGTRITLTSLTDLVLLTTVWLCVNLRPVREFCVFAAVVIITDWFMLLTFFLTILSIDAQRLELADVLASGSPTDANRVVAEKVNAPPDAEPPRATGWRKVLRARSARVGSFIFLLSSVGLLYYLTESRKGPLTTAMLYGYSPSPTTTAALRSGSATPFATTADDIATLSASELFWRALNPAGWPSIRVSIPSASIIVMPTQGHTMAPADLRKLSVKTSRLLLPRLKPLFYLFKVVVLPQAATATALYALLLYLLKDADLLDAQRNRLGRGDPAPRDASDTPGSRPSDGAGHGLAGSLGVHMLPCSHSCDIDILATSQNGRLVLSVGLDNSLCLWRFDRGEEINGTREMLAAQSVVSGDAVVLAAFDVRETMVAVLTRDGIAQVWQLPDDESAQALPSSCVSGRGGIIGLSFGDLSEGEEDPFMAKSDTQSSGPVLRLTVRDGSVVQLPIPDSSTPSATTSQPKNSGACVRLLKVETAGHEAITALVDAEGCVLIQPGDKSSTPLIRIRGTSANEDDQVSALAIATVDPHTFHAVGHRSGAVEIVDELGQVVVERSNLDSRPIKHVCLVPGSSKCSGCRCSLAEGMFLLASTSVKVHVLRVSPRGLPVCRCSQTRRRASSIDTSVSFVGSTRPSPQKSASLVVPPNAAYSPDASPARTPGLAPPVSNGEFPLSSHGTRRLSTMHRDDFFGVRPPSPLDKHSTGMLKSPSYGSTTTSASTGWNEMELTSMGAVRTPSGGAVLLDDNTLVGLRKSGAGIDDAVWQVWALDLASCWNGHSLTPTVAPLHWLVQRTLRLPAEMSMRDRRAERLLSLRGRATFSSAPGLGSAGGGASSPVPTYAGLGYVSVGPLVKRDDRSLIAAFGNRLGVITLPPRGVIKGSAAGIASALSTPRAVGVGLAKNTPPSVFGQGPPLSRKAESVLKSAKTE